VYLFYADKELEKCQSNEQQSLNFSPTTSLSSTPESAESTYLPTNIAYAFGIMMSDLTEILEQHKGSLKKMMVAFEHMVRVMKSKIYKALIHSRQYKEIKSVHDFFGALAKYWKPVDCSLLYALVKATQCQPAMERLKAFLYSRNESEEVALLLRQDQEPPNQIERSSLVGHESAHQSDSLSEVSAAKNTTDPPSIPLLEVPKEPTLPNQLPNDAVCSQPQAQSDSLPVTVVVGQDGLTLAEYDHKANILCGVLRIPRFMLQLIGIKPGCVIIKWSTAEGLLPYMLSNVIVDTDLRLLLQEKIVSIQVGSEYYITAGSQDFWICVSRSA